MLHISHLCVSLRHAFKPLSSPDSSLRNPLPPSFDSPYLARSHRPSVFLLADSLLLHIIVCFTRQRSHLFAPSERENKIWQESLIATHKSVILKFSMARIFLKQIRAGCSYRRFLSSSNSNYDLAIADLNREMESIFGEPPPQSGTHGELPSTSAIDKLTAQEYLDLSSSDECKQDLSHVDNSGKARMVDVSSKEDSKRSAVASCRVLLGKHAFNLVAANQIVKGDVLNVAKIAGIQGAKQTSNLIPLCHNISLTSVDVDLILNKEEFSVEIVGEAATTAKTGVEMEAMTAVAVAGLTVYDMCKAVTKDIQITNICLEHKSGGKSGSWSRKRSLVSDDDCV